MAGPRGIETFRLRVAAAYGRAARLEDELVHALNAGVRPYGGAARSRQWSEQAAAYRRDGWTLEEIAVEFGVSRERVRQVLARDHQLVGWVGRDRRQQYRLFTEFAERATHARECKVCGYWAFRRGITCGGECAEAWVQFRLYLDPDQRKKHDFLVAQAGLRSGEPIRVRHAKRVLAGTVENRGRWINSIDKWRFLQSLSPAVQRALDGRVPGPSPRMEEVA